MTKTISQFIPILLIFFLSSYFTSFIQFSNTIFGKLLAVTIIIFYTYIDKITGLFVCSLVILFYQLHFVETMDSIDEYAPIDINDHLVDDIIDPETNAVNIIDDEIYLPEGEIKKNIQKKFLAH